MLAEYGAHSKNGKLCDLAGREIRFMKSNTSHLTIVDWVDRYRFLEAQGYTIFVVDVPEDE
jgi:hypothetical protein